MRILYGVCGEGFGHSSRAREIIPYLEKKGHKVKIVTYGQAYNVLKAEGFDVFRITGFHIEFGEGKLEILETIKHGFFNMIENVTRIAPLKRIMEKFKPEVCISDMEPIVPILSFWYRIPLVSVDNQHRITNLDIKVPQRYYQDYLLAKIVVNRFISRADWYIVTSFSPAKIIEDNTIVVPPILRKEIAEIGKARDGKYILVYLTKPEKRIINVLKRLDGRFVVYGFNKNSRDGNIIYKKPGKHFLLDLRDCRAIIGTAGFTLISEALFLRKPYFALPLPGQFEQILNALFLKQSGYGDYTDSMDGLKERIERFFSDLEDYRKKIKKYNANNNKIFKALDYVMKWLQKKRK